MAINLSPREIDLPPYNGSNTVTLTEIQIGSAQEFRENLNSNSEEVANALNQSANAYCLWSKTWSENIGIVYWEGVTNQALAGTGTVQINVGVIEDTTVTPHVTTTIPKILSKYQVKVAYGSGTDSVTFDTLYYDNAGAEMSFDDSTSGVHIKISATSSNITRNVIIKDNNSTATNLRVTMSIDVHASKYWNEVVKGTSAEEIQKIHDAGEEEFQKVHDAGDGEVTRIEGQGDIEEAKIHSIGTLLTNVALVGNQTDRKNFETEKIPGEHVYLWFDTGI